MQPFGKRLIKTLDKVLILVESVIGQQILTLVVWFGHQIIGLIYFFQTC